MSIYNYNNSSFVFLIGNGINLLSDTSKSWESILNRSYTGNSLNYVKGYPLTEYFDLIVLNENEKYTSLRNRFLEEVSEISGRELQYFSLQ